MKITTQHSEAQRGATWQDVKERFFFYRDVLHARRVIERNTENAAFVEAHLADPPLTGTQFAKVTAGGADQGIAGKFFDQLTRSGRNIEFILKCFEGHDSGLIVRL